MPGRRLDGLGLRGLGETVAGLMAMRSPPAGGVPATTDLVGVVPTGGNPGHLKMFAFVPPGLPPGAPLVVALHGCTQNAAGYDAGAGWSTLARRHGFAVLLPQQDSANNANTCFNWFQPADVMRGSGEVQSIAQMVEQMIAAHGLDAARVYVTGLSAGGAMTAAMLATYPELFAGGAIIAGLPFGAASGMSAAFEAMRHLRSRSPAEWGELVRQASPHRGPRPSVQIWHGEADATVRPAAFEESVKQWSDVLGVHATPVSNRVDGAAHQAWTGVDGRVVLETYLVPGLGHGVPLRLGAADLDESVGNAVPFMLEAGIGSTYRIARAWGLLTQAARVRADARPRPAPPPQGPLGGLTGTIEETMRAAQDKLRAAQEALRAAGLKF